MLDRAVQPAFIDITAGFGGHMLGRNVADCLARVDRASHDRRRDCRGDPEVEDVRHDVVGVQLRHRAPSPPEPGRRRASSAAGCWVRRNRAGRGRTPGKTSETSIWFGIVGPSGGDHPGPAGSSGVGVDFRGRHRQREDDRIGRHRADHRLRSRYRRLESPMKTSAPSQHVFQRTAPHFGVGFAGDVGLGPVHAVGR